VSSEQKVTIDAYDLRGRKVRSLVDRVYQAGERVESWDLRDDLGSKLASGVYFIRMRTDTGHQEVRRVTYVK